MTARTIIPAPSLFKTFLKISGLKIPVAYVCTYLLEPICDWIQERQYPSHLYAIEAQAVRDAAKETGLERFPLMLNDREACPNCGKFVLMLVQPVNVCFYCWPEVD